MALVIKGKTPPAEPPKTEAVVAPAEVIPPEDNPEAGAAPDLPWNLTEPSTDVDSWRAGAKAAIELIGEAMANGEFSQEQAASVRQAVSKNLIPKRDSLLARGEPTMFELLLFVSAVRTKVTDYLTVPFEEAGMGDIENAVYAAVQAHKAAPKAEEPKVVKKAGK
jgi:hypothetical protein